ncbi:hypothetical protein RB597_005733 [Gaeumannomyces tritici]
MGNKSIRDLPWEIISYVVRGLGLDEVISLSMSCRHFQWLVRDDNICKRLLESQTPSAPESQSARKTKKYARELRRLVKRRDAVSSASPYLVAVVADAAESFLYSDGVLCYLSESFLRVLDLHNSVPWETVISVSELLDKSLPSIPKEGQDFDFSLVHYSHGFFTCRYSHNQSSPGWIIIVNLAKGRVFSHILESAHKLIVRNNDEFLYYGTHTDTSDTDHRCWEVRGCNLQEETWFEHKLRLTDIVGSEVGTNICFEIIDGHFYCVANQAIFEREEIAWTSYYTYLRFPVNRPKPRNAETVEPEDIWRRFHAEGPIDERWTFLRLVKNETTGALTIVEGRKEWIKSSSKNRRTYYSSELRFSGEGERASSTDSLAGFSSATESHTRSPYEVHPGDDAASPWTFTINNSLMLSYHPSCQTYLDLVNDPLPTGRYQNRFRLRAGSRRFRLESEIEELEASSADLPNNPLYPEKEIHRLYKASDITLWPPDHWEQEHGAAALQELYNVFSPPGQRVSATWDERSVCYAAGQTIVFVSFDPSIRLQGIKPWRRGVGEGCEQEGTVEGRQEVPPALDRQLALPAALVAGTEPKWIRHEHPRYSVIQKGFHFMSSRWREQGEGQRLE